MTRLTMTVWVFAEARSQGYNVTAETLTATAKWTKERFLDRIDKPRDQVSMFECHDCFSITELVTMEDLQLSPEGGAIKDVMNGFYDADGQIPCQIDGGLKCFGHPIGASGLRMAYEVYNQLRGTAGPRQVEGARHALQHNLGLGGACVVTLYETVAA